MGRLGKLPARLKPAGSRLTHTANTSEKRMTGSSLQARRHKLWAASPYCAECGRLVGYPRGFELDHKVPLFKGGADAEDNCQILCNGPGGCHEKKTRADEAAR